MPIVGDHPEHGLRFVLERGPEGPPWDYRGSAFTKDDAFPLEARVEADGTVSVTGATDARAPSDLAEKTRLLLRALWKQAKADGERGPPKKIVRWRGEK